MAPKTAVAPKQKQAPDAREVWARWRDVFDPERFVPGLAFEQETLADLKGPRLEQAIGRVRERLEAEKPLEAALDELVLRNAPEAEQEKAATAIRKAREASREAATRVEALERAIPQQRALIQRLAKEALEKQRDALPGPHAELVAEMAQHARRLAELSQQEAEYRDRADRTVQECIKLAGKKNPNRPPSYLRCRSASPRFLG